MDFSIAIGTKKKETKLEKSLGHFEFKEEKIVKPKNLPLKYKIGIKRLGQKYR